jgi:hypothetical protein
MFHRPPARYASRLPAGRPGERAGVRG